jgi:hypothetical protein
MPTNLLHRRRSERERGDPGEGRYRRAVEVVRTRQLDRLADVSRARWNTVADLTPKPEAVLLRDRALAALEHLIGGRYVLADEVVRGGRPDFRVVVAPHPRDPVVDRATALFDEADALSARLARAEVATASARRPGVATQATSLATAETRQLGPQLSRAVEELEFLVATCQAMDRLARQDAARPAAQAPARERTGPAAAEPVTQPVRRTARFHAA